MLQSILIHRINNSLEEAVRWVISHGYKANKIDITESYYRFRQVSPSTLKNNGYKGYITKTIDKKRKIKFVIAIQ